MDDLYSNTKIGETIVRFHSHLGVALYQHTIEAYPKARIDAIIPKPERRRVWNELKQRGWKLPELQLPDGWRTPIWMAFYTAIITAVAQVWTLLLALVEGSYWYWKLTRPLAVLPPPGYETVEQVALQTTRFGIEDYRQGLWPREVLAAKVRSILAYSLSIPYDQITDETKLQDLADC